MRTTSKQLAFIALFGESLRRRVALPPYWRQQPREPTWSPPIQRQAAFHPRAPDVSRAPRRRLSQRACSPRCTTTRYIGCPSTVVPLQIPRSRQPDPLIPRPGRQTGTPGSDRVEPSGHALGGRPRRPNVPAWNPPRCRTSHTDRRRGVPHAPIVYLHRVFEAPPVSHHRVDHRLGSGPAPVEDRRAPSVGGPDGRGGRCREWGPGYGQRAPRRPGGPLDCD